MHRSRPDTSCRTIKIYGPSDKRHVLEPKLIWATPGQRGFPNVPPGGIRSIPGAPAPRTHVPPPIPAPSGSRRSAPVQQQRATAAQQEALRKQQEAVRKQQEAFAKAEELRTILNNLEKVDDEGRRASLLDTLCAVDDILGLPEHPNPPSVSSGELRVNLLKHQVNTMRNCTGEQY